ncbi:solute:sodium symporter family protein [Cystoisospora suis]|uniref:Solute:sodium symporter family protein n=1 Tax=Cystoisospora suis TaxID=483139 RepID=A0A2C6L784_9APIC|nr:solute:sodium symporter family protein [Cystoisospora suis]
MLASCSLLFFLGELSLTYVMGVAQEGNALGFDEDSSRSSSHHLHRSTGQEGEITSEVQAGSEELPSGVPSLNFLEVPETAAIVCLTLLFFGSTVVLVSKLRAKKRSDPCRCRRAFKYSSAGLDSATVPKSSCPAAVPDTQHDKERQVSSIISDRWQQEANDGEGGEAEEALTSPVQEKEYEKTGQITAEKGKREDEKTRMVSGSRSFLLVRGSRDRSWKSLTLSFFSSGVGTWILYCPPQLSALYGMWPAFLYAVAIAAPMWVLAYAGPIVREEMKRKMVFGFTDYVRERFGRGMQIVVALVGFFSILVAMAGELAFAAAATKILSPHFPILAVIVLIAAVTFTYTVICGTNGSVITDWCQSTCLPFLLFLVLVTCLGTSRVSADDWGAAARWTDAGAFSGALMVLSCVPAYAMDQGMWQRVLSGRRTSDVRRGLLFGSLLASGTITVMGLTGVLASATAHLLNREGNDYSHNNLIQLEEFTSAPFFFLALPSLRRGFLGVVLFLAVVLAASSVDTFQSALPSLAAVELRAKGISVGWGSLVSLVANIPAVLLAYCWEESIIVLFLIGNLLTSSIFPPVFLGLWAKTTTVGSVTGSVAGIFSIFCSGLAFTSGNLGLAARWITLPLGLEHPSALYTFLIVPATSFVTTIVVSLLHHRIRGSQTSAASQSLRGTDSDTPEGSVRNALELASHSKPSMRLSVVGCQGKGEAVEVVKEQNNQVSCSTTTISGEGTFTYHLNESVEGKSLSSVP